MDRLRPEANFLPSLSHREVGYFSAPVFPAIELRVVAERSHLDTLCRWLVSAELGQRGDYAESVLALQQQGVELDCRLMENVFAYDWQIPVIFSRAFVHCGGALNIRLYGTIELLWLLVESMAPAVDSVEGNYCHPDPECQMQLCYTGGRYSLDGQWLSDAERVRLKWLWSQGSLITDL